MPVQLPETLRRELEEQWEALERFMSRFFRVGTIAVALVGGILIGFKVANAVGFQAGVIMGVLTSLASGLGLGLLLYEDLR